MNKVSLMLGASLALAWSAHLPAAEPTRDAGKVPPTVPAPAANHGGIADVMTTATKVETTLQKNPQTVSTLLGPVLLRQGVSTLQPLSKLVSGLQVERLGPGSSIYIRGIGSRVVTPSADPAVAFSVDGIYYARTLGTGTTLFDVARVEVVKGPQGTLYGRNATGGAVNVVSNHPVLGARTLEGELEVGNYGTVRAIEAVNMAVGDTLAVRIAGQSNYHRGYLSDGYDDENTKAVRTSVLFKPHDGFSLYLSGDYAHQGGMGAAVVPVGPGANNGTLTTRFVVPDAPFTGPSDPRINAFVHAATPATGVPFPAPGAYCVGMAAGPDVAGAPAIPFCSFPGGIGDVKPDGYNNNDFYGANATADVDVGIGRLTAIGGYRGTKEDARYYIEPRSHQDRDKINQYTGELRLGSQPDHVRFKWLVGAFFLRESQDVHSYNVQSNSATPNPFPPPGSIVPGTICVVPLTNGLCITRVNELQAVTVEDPALVNQTLAGFAQATFAPVPWLRLTGGVRYTKEKKSERDGVNASIFSIPAGLVDTGPSHGSVKFSNVSYRAGIDMDIAAHSLLFATYSTAFHAGGFNSGVREGPNNYEYKPEKVTSYAVGVKNRFFDNRVQFNVEGFWLQYADYQQNTFGPSNDGSYACSTLMIVAACPLSLRTTNAAGARVRGVEMGLVIAPARNTILNVNMLYNDAKFKQFDIVNPFSGQTSSYAGHRLPGANPLTITGGINQIVPLANGGRLIADARTQYKHGSYLWFVYTPASYQDAYTRTDASLTYELPGDHVSITGFVRNVENHATILQSAPSDVSTGALWTYLNPPRTFGGILSFKF